MSEAKRRSNEARFPTWESLPDGGRRYVLEVAGRGGWSARYVKEVNSVEETIRFAQEIYDPEGRLIETHEKFPTDLGHQRVEGQP
jgi:hypothetical protein